MPPAYFFNARHPLSARTAHPNPTPSGVDFETAEQLGKKVIWALSLPGKVAPETAGDFIMNTIMNVMEELGV